MNQPCVRFQGACVYAGGEGEKAKMAVTTTATQTGVIPAPSGWVVDLENPTRKQDRTAYIVSGLGMIFCTLCLLMRIYTKAKTARAFGMEDGM